MDQETGDTTRPVFLAEILETDQQSSTPNLPLHSFLTPARPIKLTPEEIITRRVFSYLDGRRWGYARQAREELLRRAQAQGAPLVSIFLLECMSDIFEGKPERAAKAYRRALTEEPGENYVLDFYILRELITYLGSRETQTLELPVTADELARVRWFLSPIASVLYRSSQETGNFVINELGQLADTLIDEPGVKRFIAVILRAIQGNRLIERGEYAWAERVLNYTAKRADRLMNFNTALTGSIRRDLAIAHNGVAHLSYQ